MNQRAKTYARALFHYAFFFCGMTASTAIAVMAVLVLFILLLSVPTGNLEGFVSNLKPILGFLMVGAAFMIYTGGPLAIIARLPVWALIRLALGRIGIRRSFAATVASIPTAWIGVAAMMVGVANPKWTFADLINFSFPGRLPSTDNVWLSPLIALCATIVGPLLALRMFPDHG